MQLLYMWIKDYRCLKEVGLNFSSKYKFDFNLDKYELIFSENNKAIDGFFNVISKEKIENERIVEKLKNEEYDIFKFIKDETINDLTAIVGNNGAGKSTVLNLVCDVFTNGLDNLIDGIYCFIEEKKIYIHSTLGEHIHLIKNSNMKFYKCKLEEENNNKLTNYFKFNLYTHVNGKKVRVEESTSIVTNYNNSLIQNTPIIFCSNEFNSRYSYNPYKPIIDISTSGLITEDKHNDYENHKVGLDVNLIKCFNDNELVRQIEYICDSNENKSNYLDFELPKQVSVIFRDNTFVLMKIYKSLNSKYKNNESIVDINNDLRLQINEIEIGKLDINTITEENKLLLNIYQLIEKFKISNIHSKWPKAVTKKSLYIQFSISMLMGMFISFLYEYLIAYITDEGYTKKIIGTMNISLETNFINNSHDLLNQDMLYKAFITFFESVLDIREKTEEEREYIDCIKKFSAEIDEGMVNDTMNYASSSKVFTLYLGKKNIMSNLEYFYSFYKKTSKWLQYLNFSWGISSGEYNMISLFARLYSILDKATGRLKYFENDTSYRNTQKNEIIILIDEADLSYHPEWQQKYIKNLLGFLKENYNTCGIQLLITTHSPILLSDIPDNNVIFLKKNNGITKVIDRKIQTFGANIYDLYRNGFFLNGNNYGVLGDFATEKIEELQSIINTINNKINAISENIKSESKNIDIDKSNIYKILLEKDTLINEKIEYCRKIIDFIGEKFIKRSLLKQYNQIYNKLFAYEQNFNDDKLDKLKKYFNELSKKEQDILIKHIINQRE